MTGQDMSTGSGALERALGAIDTVLTRTERILTIFAAMVTLFVMVIVSAVAVGRYFFNSPLTFTVEMVSRFLLPIMMLLAAGLVLRAGKHISVDLFAAMLPLRVYHALVAAGLYATAAVFWIMATRVGEKALSDFENGKTSFGIIPWPLWIEPAIYFVCLTVMLLRLTHVATANTAAAVTGKAELAISKIDTHEFSLEETF